MSVPSNLIPTTITQLPEAPVASPSGYFPIVIAGTTYKVQFSQISANVTVPPSRRVNAGTGLTGGGTLSADITIAVESGGITDTQLNTTGVAAGTYGSSATIPVITVTDKGRITSVTEAPLLITGYVPTSRTLTAGNGLTGGGNLAADRSFAVDYSSATPLSVGSATVGTSVQLSRGDHVHPAINLSSSTQTSGTLGVSKGGTGNAIVPVPGALIYSNGTYLDQADQGTVGYILKANGTAAPTWIDPGTLDVAQADNLNGGAANRIAYQTAPDTTGFLTAPTSSETYLKWDGSAFVWASVAGAGGNVVGPGSSTVNAVARFDNTTGTLLKDTSDFVIDNNNNVGIGGTTSATAKVLVSGNQPISGSSGDVSFGVANKGAVATTGASAGAAGFYNEMTAQPSAAIQSYFHYLARQPTLTIGASVVTQIGYAAGQLSGAGSNWGFVTTVPPGAGNYGFYEAGGAKSSFAGKVGFGVGGSIDEAVQIGSGGKLRLDGATNGYTTLKAPTTGNNIDYTLPAADGSNGYVLSTDGSGNLTWASSASGDVVGPASSTVNAIAIFDGTTGQLIKEQADITSDTFTSGLGIVGGRLNIGGSTAYGRLNIFGVLPTAATASISAGAVQVAALDPPGPAYTVSTGYGFYNELNLTNGSQVGSYAHFKAVQNITGVGAGVQYQVGFWADDTIASGTVGNYGLYAGLTSGANKWNTYAYGTAKNYFRGNVGIGLNNDNPGSELDVKGTIRLSGSSSGFVGLTAASSAGSTTYTLPFADGANGYVLSTNGSGVLSWAAAASGDVVGPAGATSTAVALFDGGTGKLLKNSPVTISSTGVISGVATPEANTDAANKLYVDGLVSTGLTFHDPVQLATTSAFTGYSITYNNGSSGVSATITQASSYSSLTIDSTAAAVNNRILVKDAANAAYNGVYYVTSTGSGATPWVLTRTSDADTYGPSVGQLSRNDYFFTQNGVANKGAAFVCTTSGTITFGTTGITFTEFSTSQVYTVGNGLSLTGTTISLETPVSVLNGGTGLSSAASNGQLPIGNGAGFTLSTLSAGTGIGITNSTGSISIANTAPDQTVTLTGSTAISVSGTYPSFTLTNTAPDKTVILTGSGGTSISGTYPSFTISSTSNPGTVTSVDVSGGSTGLTTSGGPVTSSGAITLAGTLAITAGGTGASSQSGARTALGLGTMATQDASSVVITGGSIGASVLVNLSNATGTISGGTY